MTVSARLDGAMDKESGEQRRSKAMPLSGCGTPGKAATPAFLAPISYLRTGRINTLQGPDVKGNIIDFAVFE